MYVKAKRTVKSLAAKELTAYSAPHHVFFFSDINHMGVN